jgi:hypothetical protein
MSQIITAGIEKEDKPVKSARTPCKYELILGPRKGTQCGILLHGNGNQYCWKHRKVMEHRRDVIVKLKDRGYIGEI